MEKKTWRDSPFVLAMIVLTIIFCWPLGLMLLSYFITSNKTQLMQRSALMLTVGIIFLVVGLPAVLMAFAIVVEENLTSSAEDLVVLVLFISMPIMLVLGGVAMVAQSVRIGRRAAKYRRYIEQIVNYQQHSLVQISVTLGLGQQEVVSDVQDMITLGYFEDAYIDYQNLLIVLPAPSSTAFVTVPIHVITQEAAVLEGYSAPVSRVVKCRFCGANSTLAPNQLAQCQYCGSPV